MDEAGECGRQLEALSVRLAGRSSSNTLKAVYLDLVTTAGQLQGLAGDARRELGDTEAMRAGGEALDAMKADLRQVGLDIRLSSTDSLQFGLQTAVENGIRALTAIDAAHDEAS